MNPGIFGIHFSVRQDLEYLIQGCQFREIHCTRNSPHHSLHPKRGICSHENKPRLASGTDTLSDHALLGSQFRVCWFILFSPYRQAFLRSGKLGFPIFANTAIGAYTRFQEKKKKLRLAPSRSYRCLCIQGNGPRNLGVEQGMITGQILTSQVTCIDCMLITRYFLSFIFLLHNKLIG